MSKYSLIESLTGALLGQSRELSVSSMCSWVPPSGQQRSFRKTQHAWESTAIIQYHPRSKHRIQTSASKARFDVPPVATSTKWKNGTAIGVSKTTPMFSCTCFHQNSTARSFRVRFASTSVVQKGEHYSLPQGKAILGFRFAL
ncbi:hypothetical protein NPIL_676651 [Nephila pilipes]|uniref:Uncharacterized protein n=1 Tax=Nephila pilipes TaxID=299642 RepID=A0A8X6PMB2_NEPPI|nr:hypothetical protein NPIL_676651 [Nephila pilipes]